MVKGGGDCFELIFNGVIDVIENGDFYVGLFMFVFIDVGVKDGERFKYIQENFIGFVLQYMIFVNFFYSIEFGCCGFFCNYDSFIDFMDSIGGFGLQFNFFGQILKMGNVVFVVLDGIIIIDEG